jgi:hypothetical protein
MAVLKTIKNDVEAELRLCAALDGQAEATRAQERRTTQRECKKEGESWRKRVLVVVESMSVQTSTPRRRMSSIGTPSLAKSKVRRGRYFSFH